jgi:hypothetical protein
VGVEAVMSGDDDIESRLTEVLDRHLGRYPGNRPHADSVIVATNHPDKARGFLGAMDTEQQKDTLYNIGRLLRELVRAQKTLHAAVDWEIAYALSDAAEDPSQAALDPNQEYEPNERQKELITSWDKLSALSQIIDRIVPKINNFINAAPDEGKRDMRMIVAVDLLSDIWAERKGVSARKKVADASPFARFVAEAFEALGVGYDARSSINSWYEYQKKNPNPRDWRCGRPRK